MRRPPAETLRAGRAAHRGPVGVPRLARCRSASSAATVGAGTPAADRTPAFSIVDTTLREGEQFATCEFTPHDRVYIAMMLDQLGVEYIEVVNPAASAQAVRDCEAIARLKRSAKVLTHTRCHMHDVAIAVGTGVDGVNMYMATSPILREHSHGQGIDKVIETAAEVIGYVRKHNMEVRFSCEDTFRSSLDDTLRIYREAGRLGVDRVGIADTVGIATPGQVRDVVQAVRAVLPDGVGIEFHAHNDTGCCIANALAALEAGATHIDTSVLGIGERNGITPLGGFLARMYTIDKHALLARYDLKLLRLLEKYVARAANVAIPFNNYITGSAAYTHKAGVHSKAVMQNPGSYEIIDPDDFGVERKVQLAHRLTGWNAMAARAKQLGLNLSDDQIKAATTRIKNLADIRKVTVDQVDAILMRLAAGPRTASSAFVTWTSHAQANPALATAARRAAEALAAYEAAAAADAVVQASDWAECDQRPRKLVRVDGHLFDKALLNRIMDLAVDSACEFEVVELNVSPTNEGRSNTLLRFMADRMDAVDALIMRIRKLVDSHTEIADCTMSVLDDTASVTAAPIV